MTCYNADDTTVRLCPDCLQKNGTYCIGCGVIEDSEYCDECMDEFEQDDFWGDDSWDDDDGCDDNYEYDDEDFPNGSLDY